MTRMTILVTMSCLAFLSCNPRTNILGKWTRQYSGKDEKLGALQYEYILNIGKSNMYSITTRAKIIKIGVSKMASQESGVWQLKSGGVLTLIPRLCLEKNEAFELEEFQCESSWDQTVQIQGDRWQFTLNNGEKVELTKESE